MKRTNAELIEALEEVSGRLDTYNGQLKDHMQRTALLEQAVELQKTHLEHRTDELDKRTLRIYESLSERIKSQEAVINGLPAKAVQYISILGGIGALIRALL